MTSHTQRHLRQTRPFDSLEEEVFLALQVLADRVLAPWAQDLRTHANLSPVQYNVLRILRGAGAPGLLAGEIGERLITRSPDVTRLVDRLEARGLVRRCADADDRRAVRVHVTAEGLAVLASLDERARESLRAVLRPLARGRLRSLRDELDEALGALEPGL